MNRACDRMTGRNDVSMSDIIHCDNTQLEQWDYCIDATDFLPKGSHIGISNTIEQIAMSEVVPREEVSWTN